MNLVEEHGHGQSHIGRELLVPLALGRTCPRYVGDERKKEESTQAITKQTGNNDKYTQLVMCPIGQST